MDEYCGGPDQLDQDQRVAYARRVVNDQPNLVLVTIPGPKYLLLGTLSMVREQDASQIRYEDLKFWLDDLFGIVLPSWRALLSERKVICPPLIAEDSDEGQFSNLQAVLDKTTDRFGHTDIFHPPVFEQEINFSDEPCPNL